ncbi:unnamed protein product, partial [Linum tenue]
DCPLLSPCLVSVTNGRPQLSLPFRFPPSFSNSLPSPCPVLSLSPQHPNLRRYHRSISNNSVALLHGADDGRLVKFSTVRSSTMECQLQNSPALSGGLATPMEVLRGLEVIEHIYFLMVLAPVHMLTEWV